VTEENDARFLLLLRGETSIAVDIQPPDDLLQSLRRLSVLKHRRMERWQFLLSQAPNDLHLWMPAVILLDKSTNETEHNCGGMKRTP
jgi:hypothetical protein